MAHVVIAEALADILIQTLSQFESCGDIVDLRDLLKAVGSITRTPRHGYINILTPKLKKKEKEKNTAKEL